MVAPVCYAASTAFLFYLNFLLIYTGALIYFPEILVPSQDFLNITQPSAIFINLTRDSGTISRFFKYNLMYYQIKVSDFILFK